MPQTDPLPRSTERLTLRRLREGDLRAFQAYRHDEMVGRYQSWCPTSDDAARTFLNQMNAADAFTPGDWFQIGIADRESDLLVGDIGVCVSRDGAEAEIGFTLRRASQERGLAADAVGKTVELLFAVTEVQRVIAITDTRNVAAIRLLSKLGMECVETKEAVFRGAPCTEHTFAVAKPRSAHPKARSTS